MLRKKGAWRSVHKKLLQYCKLGYCATVQEKRVSMSHQHLRVATKLRCEHQAWTQRGHWWQHKHQPMKSTYTSPCTIGQSCLHALLGGFPHNNRASFLCLWQMFQWSDSSTQCIRFSEKAPCLLQLIKSVNCFWETKCHCFISNIQIYYSKYFCSYILNHLHMSFIVKKNTIGILLQSEPTAKALLFQFDLHWYFCFVRLPFTIQHAPHR